eukprot:jgi/Mesen1/10049/ME000073S09329
MESAGSCCMSATSGTLTDGNHLPEESSSAEASLDGYYDRVADCNTGMELVESFLPLSVPAVARPGGQAVIGYVHHEFAEKHLRQFSDVFEISPPPIFTAAAAAAAPAAAAAGKASIGRHPFADGENGEEFSRGRGRGGIVFREPWLGSAEKLSEALDRVARALHAQGLIPGWREEKYAIKDEFHDAPFGLIERAAAPFFGIKVYGVHINAYTEDKEGQKFLWVARRSADKPTYPGRLDHLVAGGQPFNMGVKENVLKECDEEASVPRHLAEKAVATGVVSYASIRGWAYKRDVLFCFDLPLPRSFVPVNQDGEVASFELMPVADVARLVRSGDEYKPNCALVVVHFLLRHGYITPDQPRYVELLRSLQQLS